MGEHAFNAGHSLQPALSGRIVDGISNGTIPVVEPGMVWLAYTSYMYEGLWCEGKTVSSSVMASRQMSVVESI